MNCGLVHSKVQLHHYVRVHDLVFGWHSVNVNQILASRCMLPCVVLGCMLLQRLLCDSWAALTDRFHLIVGRR